MKKYSIVFTVVALLAGGCERERRDFKVPGGEHLTQATRLTTLQPGAASPAPRVDNPFQDNAYAISEGKRLFSAYNCNGCHANGGGGIGPALMDRRWIYGSQPDQIFSTIVQGRPDGMPSFGGRVAEKEVWQLVAYVTSMSGNARMDAAPSRNDDMSAAKPEMERKPQAPIQTGHR